MTREEAIRLIGWLKCTTNREDDLEAIDMAIEALSAKPQTDLISRADAIEAVGEWMQKEYGYLDLNRAERLIDALSSLPSADAVQGEWIDRSNGGRIKYPWWESCECNQCGEYGSGAYNFCPNCGARMKGGDDE